MICIDCSFNRQLLCGKMLELLQISTEQYLQLYNTNTIKSTTSVLCSLNVPSLRRVQTVDESDLLQNEQSVSHYYLLHTYTVKLYQ